MKISEMILVTENWKGQETNYIASFEDYKKYILMDSCDTKNELADAVMDLCESISDKKHWSEIFWSCNKSVVAKYCSGRDELRSFLQGCLNSSHQEWRFDESRCSLSCLETLQTVGIDYLVVEKQSDRKCLLLNENNEEFLDSSIAVKGRTR